MTSLKLALALSALALASSAAAAAETKVLNDDAWFAEGPIWYKDKLYYVEYGRGTVMTWDGKTNTVFWKQDGCGPSAVVPTRRANSRHLLQFQHDRPDLGRRQDAAAL